MFEFNVLFIKEIFEGVLALNDADDKAVHIFFLQRIYNNSYTEELKAMIERYYPQYLEKLKMLMVFS